MLRLVVSFALAVGISVASPQYWGQWGGYPYAGYPYAGYPYAAQPVQQYAYTGKVIKLLIDQC